MKDRLIILDTETTGIEHKQGHRVIEIGCTEIINRQITKGNEYHQYIKPDRSVGESARIHGISDKFLADKPKFEDIAAEFLEYIDDTTLVIHNAPFDLGFLNHELARMGVSQTIQDRCNIIDSLELSKQQRPGTLHSLDSLCRRFEIDTSARVVHGGLLDAKILAQVYLAMTGGQSTLFDGEQNFSKTENNVYSISRISTNVGSIKVVRASQAELKEHNNYFKGFD